MVNNGLEVIRRLTSLLMFCRGYEGSKSREGAYFNNNGVYRHAAGMSRFFDLSKFIIGWYKIPPSIYQYINIVCRLLCYDILIGHISTSPCSFYYCQDKYFY